MLAYAEFSLSPSKFEALMPHDKTLMAMLLQERGQVVAPAVALHADKRHAYALETSQDEVEPEGVSTRLLGKLPNGGKFPKLASNILKAIASAEAGVLKMTKAQMAEHFSASVYSVERVMNNLFDDGLIRRVSGTCDWSLTPSGIDLLNRMQARAAGQDAA